MADNNTRDGVAPVPRDVLGYGLAALNWVAGSPVLDRLGLRKRAEQVAFQASKTGFRVAGAASRGFSSAQGLTKPARLPVSKPSDLFDLTGRPCSSSSPTPLG